MISKTRVALACLFCALGSQAMASSQASASISNLRFQLIDLNPMDGISASVTFGTGSTTLSLSGSDGALGDSDSAARTRSGYMSFSRTYDISLDNLSGHASIADGSLNVSGSATGTSTSFNAQASSYASQLQLSAQTLLIITADASASASAFDAAACWSNYYRCSPSEQASASANMNLSYNYYTSSGSTNVNYSDSVSAYATSTGEQTVTDYGYYDWWYCSYYGYYCGGSSYYYGQTEQSTSDSRSFSAVFMNTSSSIQSAYFSVGTSVSGSANGPTIDGFGVASTTPVPEAQTTLLALFGGAVAAAAAAKRRRQTA